MCRVMVASVQVELRTAQLKDLLECSCLFYEHAAETGAFRHLGLARMISQDHVLAAAFGSLPIPAEATW